MNRQLVNWKPVRCMNAREEGYNSELPDLISTSHRGSLLEKILAMPVKTAIPFENAIQLTMKKFMEAFTAGRIGYEPEECNWYMRNFVDWISTQGYHIELTGDEFELFQKNQSC